MFPGLQAQESDIGDTLEIGLIILLVKTTGTIVFRNPAGQVKDFVKVLPTEYYFEI
jgi:hypothetical protein